MRAQLPLWFRARMATPRKVSGARHWSEYLPSANAPLGPRGIEADFRLAQLVRKRTIVGHDEASQITRRKPGTITRAVKSLEAAGLVDVMNGGGKGTRYRLAPAAAWAIGVAFERDRVVALAFDLGYATPSLEERVEIAADCEHDPDGALAAAQAAVLGAMKQPCSGELLGVGLAFPTPIGNDGACRTRMAGAWHGRRPADELQEMLVGAMDGDEPALVAIDNDAALGALGVFLRRFQVAAKPGESPTDLIYVRMADGIGLGLVLKGKFVRGGHGLAGELAHRPLDMIGAPMCRRCGRICLESVSSTSALERRLRKYGRDTLNVPIGEMIDGFGALSAGEQGVMKSEVRRAGRLLGHALAPVGATIDPEVIVLGGPIARSDELGKALREAVDAGLGEHGTPFLEEDAGWRPDVEMTKARATVPLPELRGAAAMVVQRHADAWLWWELEKLMP